MFPRIAILLFCLVIHPFSIRGVAQSDFPLLTEENLEWKLLPSDLTRKIFPMVDPADLRLKLGSTPDGQQFLRIQPPRFRDLSFGVRSTEKEGSYIASSNQAIYWPRQHLFRLEGEVVVSATHCNLEGKTLDIHLYHDTVRIEEPKEILIDDISLPTVSQGIRLSGVGHNESPDFEWDPVVEKNARSLEPTPQPNAIPVVTIEPDLPAVETKQYDIHIGERWDLSFEGETIEIEELEKEIQKIGEEAPQSSILVRQSAAANPDQVRRIHQGLESSQIRNVKTTIVPSSIRQGELNPEVEPKPPDNEFVLPALSEKGGRLLWVYEPGRYNFNGRDYTEPLLRQALRAYSRQMSNLTLVIASPQQLPSEFLREFVRDIRAYGFTNILVGVDPTLATE